jgi:hypothetical protein
MDYTSNKQFRSNALKVARAVTLFAVLSASIFLILFTLENIDEWRPHAVAASVMIAFGIVIPVFAFIGNSKLRKFAVDYVRNIFLNFKISLRSSRVEPIIVTIC